MEIQDISGKVFNTNLKVDLPTDLSEGIVSIQYIPNEALPININLTPD